MAEIAHEFINLEREQLDAALEVFLPKRSMVSTHTQAGNPVGGKVNITT